MKIGYMRTSTGGQSTDSQEDDLLAAGVAAKNIYVDKLSGKNRNRPGLKECLRSLRDGEDVLVISRLSRLARSLGDLLAILEDLNARGIALEVIHQPEVDFSTAAGRLLIGVLGAVDQFQRDIIVENTREGLAAARARGRVGGTKSTLDDRKIREARAEGMSVSEMARQFRVSRATILRHLKEPVKAG